MDNIGKRMVYTFGKASKQRTEYISADAGCLEITCTEVADCVPDGITIEPLALSSAFL